MRTRANSRPWSRKASSAPLRRRLFDNCLARNQGRGRGRFGGIRRSASWAACVGRMDEARGEVAVVGGVALHQLFAALVELP